MKFRESRVLIGSKQKSMAVCRGVNINISLNCEVDPGPYFLENPTGKVGVECGVQKALIERLARGWKLMLFLSFKVA